MPDAINPFGAIHPLLNAQVSGKESGQKDPGKLEKACNDFEALFVKYMMQQMRETVPADGLLGQSQAEKIYTGLLDDEVAKSVSHGRGLGLAKAMYEQMAAMQSDEPKKK